MGTLIRIAAFTFALIGLELLIPAALAADSTPKPPNDARGDFELREWVILVCDPNKPNANDGSLFKTTVPDFVASHRDADTEDPAGKPAPIGVIRITGQPKNAATPKVDVLLELKTGQFLAQWPKAEFKSGRLLWADMDLADDATALETIPPGHWFSELRGAESAYLTRKGRAERFLMYDAEFRYTVPLKLGGTSGATAYQLTNGGDTILHDLTLYKSKPDGWHSVHIADLPPAVSGHPSTTPATSPSSAPATKSAAAPASASATTSPAASQPATPADGPTVALSAAGVANAAEVMGPWKKRLADEGLLPADCDLIVSILEKQALDPNRLTAIYRLDPSEMDKLLPLEVVPTPKKTVRVGLVLLRNIDPDIAGEVDRLIAQLGNDDWNQRESAQKQLAALGPAARPKLEQAAKHKDLEIVYRAERLLDQLTQEKK